LLSEYFRLFICLYLVVKPCSDVDAVDRDKMRRDAVKLQELLAKSV